MARSDGARDMIVPGAISVVRGPIGVEEPRHTIPIASPYFFDEIHGDVTVGPRS